MNSRSQLSELPVPRTALIGRERDLATVLDILADPETRLLTLSGVGGCGKTRLAFQLTGDLAADYPQRTWTIELAAIADPELIPTVVAESLGLPESSSTSSMAALANYLQTRPALLLLDNCEHLVDACAVFIHTLLTSCPDLRVIVTSREPLHIPGERQYRVPPLDLPDIQDLGNVDAIEASPAVQLFVTRARGVLPSFKLTSGNAEGVARICARLEGIPLALELAAARVQVLGIQQILVRLDYSFGVLVGGSRVSPTRHQTLRAALEWSDALLTDIERTVFRRLAIFNGEFRLDAVEAICTDSEIPREAMLGIVSSLADKSLIVTESGERVAWHRLLEPVSQYAREGLDDHAEAILRSRHAAFYLDLAERAAAGLRGNEQHHWLNRLERDQGNVRAALEWARQEDRVLELRLSVALAPFWEIRGHQREGLRRLGEALEHNEAAGDLELRIHALGYAGRLALYFEPPTTSRDTEAARFSQESLRLARDLGDAHTIASALRDLGMVYRVQREYTRAIEALEEALAIFQALGDEPGAMRVLLHLGLAVYRSPRSPEDRATAMRLFEESLSRLPAYGDERIRAIAQVLLGLTFQDRGEFEQAVRVIVDGVAVHLSFDDQWLVASDLLVLSEVLLDAGQPQEAVRFVAAAQAMLERLGGVADSTSFADIAGVREQIDALRGEAWFDAAWTEGYAWNTNDATLAAQALLDTLDDTGESSVLDTLDLESLTPRELEVAQLIAEEHSNQAIADTLFIAPSTVATHVHRILQKLNLRSRVQIADWLAAQTDQPNDPV
jgi:predicted ATPase/DNA-binding CsgD family transcriptional regulator